MLNYALRFAIEASWNGLSLAGQLCATRNKAEQNVQLGNVMNALGLQFEVEYENVEDLRYGKIVIMTDQVFSDNFIYFLSLATSLTSFL